MPIGSAVGKSAVIRASGRARRRCWRRCDFRRREEAAQLDRQLRSANGQLLGRAEDRSAAWCAGRGSRCAPGAAPKPPPPRMMSTSSIDGASRSIASASSRRDVRALAAAPGASRRSDRLTPENFATKIVSGPIAADQIAERLVEAADERRHADDRRDADDDAEHGERRPQLVAAERVPRHRDDLAEEAPAHRLLPPQRFDRIERRRPHRRVQAEEQPDDRRHRDAEHDRPELDDRRQRD